MFFKSDNVLARSSFSLISNNANYIIGNTLAYFRDRFTININQCTFNDTIKKIKLSVVISDDEELIIKTIWSLLLVHTNQYSYTSTIINTEKCDKGYHIFALSCTYGSYI